jgi:subtilisin family serine protease
MTMQRDENMVLKTNQNKKGRKPTAIGAAAVSIALFSGIPALLSRSTASASSGVTPMSAVTQSINANAMWAAGYTGKGVCVAVIDTGVAPVPGLNDGRVMNGPDLSFDSASAPDNALGVDAFGHGTHMAGIIAGRDAEYVGVAPDACIVSVKVGASDGATDVSQVIAALDWVTENAARYNIRVVNLSYGTAQAQDYKVDPLSWAAESAWRHGIVVVAAAGNDGNKTKLTNPAYNPRILAVAAADPTTDSLTLFSNSDGSRQADISAPGARVQGLRVGGSAIDQIMPSATGDRFVRGSGTSQAAAVVSGAAALLLQANPDATPDQIKSALRDTAISLATKGGGKGLLDISEASKRLRSRRAERQKELTNALNKVTTAEATVGAATVTLTNAQTANSELVAAAPGRVASTRAATANAKAELSTASAGALSLAIQNATAEAAAKLKAGLAEVNAKCAAGRLKLSDCVKARTDLQATYAATVTKKTAELTAASKASLAKALATADAEQVTWEQEITKQLKESAEGVVAFVDALDKAQKELADANESVVKERTDLAAKAASEAASAVKDFQDASSSRGRGSLELARGGSHVTDGGVALVGEVDAFGQPWVGSEWAPSKFTGNSWSGRSWSGNSWSGNSWSGRSWSGNSWSGRSWSGRSWSGRSWSGNSWSGNSWSGRSWSDSDWSNETWSGFQFD